MSFLRQLCVRSPILGLLRRLAARRDRVLLYHRVVADSVDPALRTLLPGALSCSQFTEQMRYLARHYQVVDLDELLAKRHQPGNRIAITFDDGYVDNLSNAMPILHDLGLPATVFVVAGHVGTERSFWWDALARLVISNGEAELCLGDDEETVNFAYEGSHPRQLHQAAAWLGALPEDRRERVLAACPLHPDDRVMTANELRQLEANGIRIGAHTMSHPRLSGIAATDATREIRDSKAALEAILGHPVPHFAYPFGERGDFDASCEAAAQAAGFLAAFAAYRGHICSTANAFALPRIPSNANADRFKLRLARY